MVSLERLLITNDPCFYEMLFKLVNGFGDIPAGQLPSRSLALKCSVAGTRFSSYGPGTGSTKVTIYPFNLRHTAIYKFNGKSCSNSARERRGQAAGSSSLWDRQRSVHAATAMIHSPASGVAPAG